MAAAAANGSPNAAMKAFDDNLESVVRLHVIASGPWAPPHLCS